MVLIAVLVQSKISLQDLKSLKRCLWICWSSGLSRPVAWRQWPTCCRRAVPSSVCSSCLKGRCIFFASSEPITLWHRVIPQTNGKIQVRGFAMTCAPCPHEYITGPLFWANPFFKIILILSCRLPSDLLPSCCLTNLLRLHVSKTRICFGC